MTKLQIGDAVKKARKAKGYSFYMVGKLTATNPGQIVSIEAGASNYTIDLLINVCKVLGISVTAGDTITLKTPPAPTPAKFQRTNGKFHSNGHDEKKPATSKADRLRSLRGSRS